MNAIVAKDFNSIVGEGSTNKLVRPFGLSKRNERNKMLINFCKQCDLSPLETEHGLASEEKAIAFANMLKSTIMSNTMQNEAFTQEMEEIVRNFLNTPPTTDIRETYIS